MAGNLTGFINHLEEQLKNGGIYVWGAQGEKASESFIKRCESGNDETRALKLYRKRLKAGYDPEKILCFDCSGLGMFYIQNLTKLSAKDKNANGMKANCTIIQKKHVKKGDFLFRVDKTGRAYHIGYMVTDEDYIESKGRDHGVIKGKLSKSGSYWHVFGRPTWFANEIDTPEERAEHEAFNRILKKGCLGDDVREMQKLLKKAGHILDVDGDFGKDTKAEVKQFQKNNRFAKKMQDGIAGELTITMLGGKWEGEVTTFGRELVNGDKGDDVKLLQVLLRKAGKNVAVDGVFGSKTEDAVREYQDAKKIGVDGIVGKKTVGKLGGVWVG